MRIALGIEYDGSRFHGWQTQPDGNTVQDVLQAALHQIAGVPAALTCAGRTDAGVHAREQVVHFDVEVERPESAWLRGVNALLPQSVAVLWARRVPEEFHARYGALERSYRYVLISRPVRPALAARYAGWTHSSLDVEAMREASRYLTGRHDFSSFRSSECQAKSPVRDLHHLSLEREGERIDFRFSANAFLHHMVRNIVGSLVQVGKGARAPEWLREVRDARDRRLAAQTAAPQGLYLESVRYEERWGLPSASGAPLPLAIEP
ncbi:MAG TPA: tRNA pseudouridine(38-40) synthase TruA [Burkholderiales bacterium]|nr:tRNA pseudouridine(38-40) synthase TruA [Burkholderiales bacterium]